MPRLRELLAHGGIAILAVVFALAFATFNLATALAREIVSVINQQSTDADGSSDWLTIFVDDTLISLAEILYSAIALVLLVLALYATWWLTRRTARSCPECGSTVPATASVCRYCTADLSPPAADA